MAQTLSAELPVNVPASRMYATLKDVHNLLPKIVPDFIRSYELVEGDGGVGTVRKITFGPLVSKEPTVAIEKVLAVDDAAKSVTYSLVEGDLTKLYSHFVATTKYVDGADESGSMSGGKRPREHGTRRTSV